ncbi:MAG: hypothetical protein AAB227_10470 [Pseudomonadota bacterium]
MRAVFVIVVFLSLIACGPEKKAPPPYARPSSDDILRAAKSEEKTAAKMQAKAKAAAAAKAKAEGEVVEKAPPLTSKDIAARKRSALKSSVASVTFSLCGWAPAKRDSFAGYAKSQPLPPAGYYCDADIVTGTKSHKKRRVFMFKTEGKWRLFPVDKKYSSKLKNFTTIDPAELAAFEAAEEAKKSKGKKKKSAKA